MCNMAVYGWEISLEVMYFWLYSTKLSAGGGGDTSRLRLISSLFYVLLTVHLSIILDNDQLDTNLLYFTIRLL